MTVMCPGGWSFCVVVSAHHQAWVLWAGSNLLLPSKPMPLGCWLLPSRQLLLPPAPLPFLPFYYLNLRSSPQLGLG